MSSSQQDASTWSIKEVPQTSKRLTIKMSLNKVVNNLVRAASSVPADISDADLDSYVEKLLAEEAKVKEAKWSELGLGSMFNSSPSRDSCVTSSTSSNSGASSAGVRETD